MDSRILFVRGLCDVRRDAWQGHMTGVCLSPYKAGSVMRCKIVLFIYLIRQ